MSSRRGLALGVVVVLAALVALAAYVRVGWWRMEAGCRDAASVTYSWSWTPLGFTCTYGDGSAETSLWPSDSRR